MAEEQANAEKTEKAEVKEEKPKAAKADDNVVYIGKKPTMSYVLAVMTQLQSGMNEVLIKARGRSISRAVDVAEVVKNKFMDGVKREIDIGTDTVQDKENKKLNISTISIKISK